MTTAKKPKVTQAVNPLSRKKQAASLPEKPLNHIALVVDESGSMGHLTQKVIEVVNSQLGTIKVASKNADQETLVSLYTFEEHTVKEHARSAFPESVNFFNYQVGGLTPLNDAIHKAMDNMEADTKRRSDESYLIIVVTDGGENSSQRGKVGDRIKAAQATDRWSFAFMVPPGAKQETISKTGVPAGNILEWEATEQGLHEAFQRTAHATTNYIQSRAMGLTSTPSFYTDLSKITKNDLSNLQDMKDQFYRWKVDQEIDIQSFVEQHARINYQPGKGYYQLTKPETIQSHKDLVIAEKKTKKLFGGPEAKKLVGISDGPGVSVRVKPGNHGNFDIFVKSTSTNRKLVRGTEFLYQK